MADYIPSGDADFHIWQQNFVSILNANPEDFGLLPADVTPLVARQSAWTNAYTANTAEQTAARAASQAKETAREEFEKSPRALARRVQGNNQVTDQQRVTLGLNVQQTTRTPTGVPSTRPIASVDTSERLRHTINFMDETTPTNRAKPDGVMGCEIWVKVGGPEPADPDELQFLGLDTSTPYVATYSGEQGGKAAYYMLRWLNGKGEQGPWSQTVSATITG